MLHSINVKPNHNHLSQKACFDARMLYRHFPPSRLLGLLNSAPLSPGGTSLPAPFRTTCRLSSTMVDSPGGIGDCKTPAKKYPNEYNLNLTQYLFSSKFYSTIPLARLFSRGRASFPSIILIQQKEPQPPKVGRVQRIFC